MKQIRKYMDILEKLEKAWVDAMEYVDDIESLATRVRYGRETRDDDGRIEVFLADNHGLYGHCPYCFFCDLLSEAKVRMGITLSDDSWRLDDELSQALCRLHEAVSHRERPVAQ